MFSFQSKWNGAHPNLEDGSLIESKHKVMADTESNGSFHPTRNVNEITNILKIIIHPTSRWDHPTLGMIQVYCQKSLAISQITREVVWLCMVDSAMQARTRNKPSLPSTCPAWWKLVAPTFLPNLTLLAYQQQSKLLDPKLNMVRYSG